MTLRAGAGREAKLNGASLRSAEQLRSEVATLVFTPDRLAVVKGGPAVRRAYFDRALGRLLPARSGLSTAYAAALAQRNAALRRIALGFSTREAIEPWTERVASLGAELVEARAETVRLIDPLFAERAQALGLRAAALTYLGEPPTVELLAARLNRDLERGSTGAGPHLDDVSISSDGRELRQFGSQGEQRVAVLSLLLAEAGSLVARGGPPPLLLLDDVLSELDRDRRAALVRQLPAGQTVVTATSPELLPVSPAQLVEVTPGHARAA